MKTCVAIKRRKEREKVMSKKLFLLSAACVVCWGFAGGFYELWRDAQDQLALAESSGKNQEAKVAELQRELGARKEFERHRAEVLRYAIIDRHFDFFVSDDDEEFATWAYLISLANPEPNASRLKETADGVPWTVQFRGKYGSGYSVVVAVEGPLGEVLKPCLVFYGGNQPGSLFRMEGLKKKGAVVESLVSDEWQSVGPQTAEECLLATDRDLYRFTTQSSHEGFE